MMNEDGTTPRPWNRENYSEIYGGIHRTGIGNDQGVVVFNGLTPLTKEDADLIHTAVNAHDDLLAAAEAWKALDGLIFSMRTLDDKLEVLKRASKTMEMTKAAIVKAENQNEPTTNQRD